MSHVIHMIASRTRHMTHSWFVTRTHTGLQRREPYVTRILMSHMSHTCLWVMSSIWMRDVTQRFVTHTREILTYEVRGLYGSWPPTARVQCHKRMHESCHQYKCVTNESCDTLLVRDTWFDHDTYRFPCPMQCHKQMHESCHQYTCLTMWMRHKRVMWHIISSWHITWSWHIQISVGKSPTLHTYSCVMSSMWIRHKRVMWHIIGSWHIIRSWHAQVSIGASLMSHTYSWVMLFMWIRHERVTWHMMSSWHTCQLWHAQVSVGASLRGTLAFVLGNLLCVVKRCVSRTATHCNTLQHTATPYNTLRHTATHCHILQRPSTPSGRLSMCPWQLAVPDVKGCAHRNTLQHTATHCDTLQHNTMHVNAVVAP